MATIDINPQPFAYSPARNPNPGRIVSTPYTVEASKKEAPSNASLSKGEQVSFSEESQALLKAEKAQKPEKTDNNPSNQESAEPELQQISQHTREALSVYQSIGG